MNEPCYCGATNCQFCGPTQDGKLCRMHACMHEHEDESHRYNDEEPNDDVLNANRLDNGWY